MKIGIHIDCGFSRTINSELALPFLYYYGQGLYFKKLGDYRRYMSCWFDCNKTFAKRMYKWW